MKWSVVGSIQKAALCCSILGFAKTNKSVLSILSMSDAVARRFLLAAQDSRLLTQRPALQQPG